MNRNWSSRPDWHGAEKLMRAPYATVAARCVDPSKCPFRDDGEVKFQLARGEVVWLQGPSGVGKTTLAAEVAGLGSARRLGIHVTVEWDASIDKRERVGALFQQTTLVDALSVGGNVANALAACGVHSVEEPKRLVEAVGLDWARDGRKMPQELSGGMARRASLALQLAQRKRVVVLDEPFTGLDERAARAVAKELGVLRREHGASLLLVSHQPALVKLVCDAPRSIALVPAIREDTIKRKARYCAWLRGDVRSRSAFRVLFRMRAKTVDYFALSLPLILLAFAAAGVAVAMLTADLLAKLDVTEQVDQILEKEVLPMVDLLSGKEASDLQKMMTRMAVKGKAQGMVRSALPKAKRVLYAQGLAKLFVIELGPLLAALLLSGRLGGSYAGEVATMQATAQNKLLKTLGRSPRSWSLLPSLVAAWAAAPVLTALGSLLAVCIGGPVARIYGLGDDIDESWYFEGVKDALLPPLRCSHDWSFYRNFVELATWPPAHNIFKALVYITLIVVVAEIISRRADLAPRDVPRAITASVVAGGLAVILGDWAFSQLLLRREWYK